ncbi:menaquinone biosynthetic enzyme MqnA/MqnD family protein [Roseimaritima sediminicola]|uniref:menaquinone biosynthetic enzyme MqnA/MqnD family protein n=1 Tax=Roseimaritima sediminicola TaxID=2662066 RepID=UPI0012984557|nr:menaquinone biosynthesis protein [Roseimaritima sediminicola]
MLRIGAVSYLNTRPLVYGLANRLGGSGRLSFNLPSRLADDLCQGRLDVALIPSIEYFRGVGHQIVSDAVIACRGPVWSVRLLSRVPVEKIRRLALDEGSRTSAALVRVLLAEQYGLHPETVPLPMESDPEAMDVDAVLLIGDRAMHPATGVYHEIWDLGDRWCRWTGLPFVFAMWVAREGVDTRALAPILSAARDEGLERLREIAAEHAGGHGLTIDDLHHYFADHLHFRLGPEEQTALRRYQRYAESLGLVPRRRELMFTTS